MGLREQEEQKNDTPLCPLDKDVHEKLSSVGAALEDDLRGWIEGLTGEKFSDRNFGKALKNGILLCQYAPIPIILLFYFCFVVFYVLFFSFFHCILFTSTCLFHFIHYLLQTRKQDSPRNMPKDTEIPRALCANGTIFPLFFFFFFFLYIYIEENLINNQRERLYIH